jgi:hypothetical protein
MNFNQGKSVTTTPHISAPDPTEKYKIILLNSNA